MKIQKVVIGTVILAVALFVVREIAGYFYFSHVQKQWDCDELAPRRQAKVEGQFRDALGYDLALGYTGYYRDPSQDLREALEARDRDYLS